MNLTAQDGKIIVRRLSSDEDYLLKQISLGEIIALGDGINLTDDMKVGKKVFYSHWRAWSDEFEIDSKRMAMLDKAVILATIDGEELKVLHHDIIIVRPILKYDKSDDSLNSTDVGLGEIIGWGKNTLSSLISNLKVKDQIIYKLSDDVFIFDNENIEFVSTHSILARVN